MPIPAEPLTGGSHDAAKAPEQLEGPNLRGIGLSREIRRHSARAGKLTTSARLDAADERDAIAHARDLAAPTRDDLADARGLREAGAADREQAARERLHALVDREILADELAVADNDPLTGARTRAAGLTDLERELVRSQRMGAELVVAYVDVVGLKTLNDTQGHEAGDALLASAVRIMKEHLRPYDLVIRLGGDEFLCAMSNMTLSDVRQRFAVIAGALAAAHTAARVRTGFAMLKPGDGVTELIARADGRMIDGRHADHEVRVAASTGSRVRPRERRAARAASVGPLRRGIVAFATAAGASERQLENIALAVSEALNNAVLHAYAGRNEPGSVAVDAWTSERSLHVVVCDEGAGMVPREASPAPGLGFGLPLIARLTRELVIEESARGVRLGMSFAIG
jgi:diguanylate cyclase (GGDEF)-like protein